MPGSHGSLTKAGKVRQLTPKVPRTGVNSRSKKIPRIRNQVLYEKFVKNMQVKQTLLMPKSIIDEFNNDNKKILHFFHSKIKAMRK